MIYAVVFITSTLCAYFASYAKRRDGMIFFSVICILLPSILGGLRQVGVGFDSWLYGLPHFLAASRSASFIDFLAADKRLYRELAWAALTYFSAKVFGSVNWSFFFHQLITLTCIYIGIYKHRKIVSLPFAWLIFFVLMHGTTYTFIRQSIAASIVFAGFNNIEEKRYFRFLIYVLIGALFHTSAVIVLSYFVAVHMFTTWKTSHVWGKKLLLYTGLGLIAAIRPIMGFIIDSSPLFSAYQGYEDVVGSSILEGSAIAGLEFGELLLCTVYAKGMKRVFAKGDMYKFYRYSLIFHLMYRLLVRVFAYRVLYFFDMVNVILLAALPRFVRGKTLRILIFMSVLFTVIMFFTAVFILKNGHQTFPYKAVINLF